MKPLQIAPSILSAEINSLQKEVEQIEEHVEMIHVDVMDGKFVPPTTFKPEQIKEITSKIFKDVHLMVEHPLKDRFIDDYIDAGANSITIHVEASDDVGACINHIKRKGVKVGLSLNPPTKIGKLAPYLKNVDMVLVMSVNPGYAGQDFIPEVLKKVRDLRAAEPNLDIQIDGGIKKETIHEAVKAGANIVVAGSAVFGQEDRVKAIKELRDAAKQ
ncbi:MAG: ribulose-phosphate 3-epimerase [Candidatus Woesearchaeota archaeon]|jgi:ribulose-phosphate 3-epimerase|nr:ribulose-phosphate 3-epimerase [Candidatus Woesearchaeota archaeon]